MSQSITRIPLLVAFFGIAAFAMMDAVMKELAIKNGAYNAVLWRCLIGAALSGSLFVVLQKPLPSREAFRVHLLRSVIVAAMAVSFFWALIRLPLAEAIALSFIAPLITLYLAALTLGETISRRSIIASCLGLAGVCIILSAKFGAEPLIAEQGLAIIAVLVSACLYAVNLVLVRRQSQIAEPVEIAFFQNLLVAAVLVLASPWLAVVPEANQWTTLTGAAMLAIVSLLLMAWAYARAEAQILVVTEYTAFLWAALFGWLWFHEPLVWQTILGAAMIICGCVLTAKRKGSGLLLPVKPAAS